MLFDSTVRRELARSFGVTFFVILTILITMVLIKSIGQAAGGAVAAQDVLLLLGYSALGYVPLVMTASLFIAIVATLGRMYRESEMTIWFASGVGLSRFVKPVVQVAWPVVLGVLVLVLVVWPWSNRNSTHLQERYQHRSDLSRVAPGKFQSSRDGSTVFFIERDSENNQNGRNVFILQDQPERESVTTSHKGHIETNGDSQFLVLENGQRNEINRNNNEKTQAHFEEYRVLADRQVLPNESQRPPKARDSLDLLQEASPKALGELAWRLGLSIGCVNMTLLGIGMAANNPRRPNNWNLLFALLSFFVYLNLINLSQSWVANGRAHFGPALLTLHGCAALIALGLLWYRDQGVRVAGRLLPRMKAST